MTSSIKPEVHHISQRRQRRTELRPQATRTKNWCCSAAIEVFELGARTMSYNKCSAVAEMVDRLATLDTGRKLEGLCPFWGRGLDLHITQCGLGRGLPPIKWRLDPSSRLAIDMGRKLGRTLRPFWMEELGSI